MLRLHSRAQLLFGELHTKTLAGFDSDNTTWHSSNVIIFNGAEVFWWSSPIYSSLSASSAPEIFVMNLCHSPRI